MHEITIGQDKKMNAARGIRDDYDLTENEYEYWLWLDTVHLKINKDHEMGHAIDKLLAQGVSNTHLNFSIMLLTIKHVNLNDGKRILKGLIGQADEKGYRRAREEIAHVVDFLCDPGIDLHATQRRLDSADEVHD